MLCTLHLKPTFLSRENSTRDNKRSLCSARSSLLKKTRHHQLSFIPYPTRLCHMYCVKLCEIPRCIFLQIVAAFISVEVKYRLLKVGFWITLVKSLLWLSHRYSWNENNLGNISSCPPYFLCVYVFEEYMKNILLRIHRFRHWTVSQRKEWITKIRTIQRQPQKQLNKNNLGTVSASALAASELEKAPVRELAR